MTLILDTGPLLAALDAGDADHQACATLLTSSSEDLIVPMLVLSELDYWCAQRLTPPVWDRFLEDLLAGAYRAEAPTIADLARCRELQARCSGGEQREGVTGRGAQHVEVPPVERQQSAGLVARSENDQ